MAYFGKISSYDSGAGAGIIIPDRGGQPLPFGKSDLQHESQQPFVDERYSFETVEVNGNRERATNLEKMSDARIQQEQARAQRG